MVYRSLGSPCEQLEVWQRVAQEIRPGVKATRTHRLALDACQQGFSAVTLQTEQPVELLTQLLQADARVILNHRLDQSSHLGHYSVLLRFDGHEIEIHDPHLGPNRVLTWPEFAKLWSPSPGPSEVIGRVLVAVGLHCEQRNACMHCGIERPSHWICERCRHPIPTGPTGAIGCVAADCPKRLWNRLFCPHCDWAASRVTSPQNS